MAARVRSRRAGPREGVRGAIEGVRGPMEGLGGTMDRVSGTRMALLPWTRHMIAVLWDQLRLLVQVIYYTFVSVFQMFRFEVHVRITDDPLVTSDPSDPFLFSSLFSEEGGADHTLRREELLHKCPTAWTATVSDWNFFVSSSETRSSDEERSAASCWSSEEEHLDFDCDESRALWESLSRSGDPYDPFCFSASISTCSRALWDTKQTRAGHEREVSEKVQKEDLDVKNRKEKNEESRSLCQKSESDALWESTPDDSWDTESHINDGRHRAPLVGRFWGSSSEEDSDAEDSPLGVRRSDSSSSWSSENSSEDSSELREEDQQLWDLFTNTGDQYNPLCFSAATTQGPKEELWRCLSKEEDPYHPLNFSALEPRGERKGEQREGGEEETQQATRHCSPRRRRGEKPALTQRRLQRHTHPQTILRPWTKRSTDSNPQAPYAPKGPPNTHRKVHFSDVVRVHVMRSWDFARCSSRKGPWEEAARDRERFRRRIQDSERTLGPCLSPERRQQAWRSLWTLTSDL